MTDKNDNEENTAPIGAGTFLLGNFTPKAVGNEKLVTPTATADEQNKSISEFENAARAQIGGSIAFVTRLKDKEADPLFFEEDD